MIARSSRISAVVIFLLIPFFSSQAQTRQFLLEGPEMKETTKSVLPSYTIREQSEDVLDMEYTFSNFSVHDITGGDGKNYQLVRMEGFGLTNEAGIPALPIRTEKIVIPEGKEAFVQVVSSGYAEYRNIDIFPAQLLTTDGQQSSPGFVKNDSAYLLDKYSPVELVQLTDVQIFRGITFSYMKITPVQYNPVDRTVRVHEKLQIRVEFRKSAEKQATRERVCKTGDYSILQESVINTQALPAEADKSGGTLDPVGYLIITVPQFEEAAYTLAEWKQQLGYHVEVVSRASWTTTTAKAVVENLYYNSSYDFRYLLLFGDHDHIPDKYFWADLNGKDWNIYSTNYYACMNGEWEYMPELAHGRISVRNASQAMLVVNKIIRYEKNPPSSYSFYNKGLHAGYFQDSLRDNISDYRYAKTTIDIYNYMTTKQGFEGDLVLYTEPTVNPLKFNPYFTGETNVPPQYLKANGYKWDGDKDDILNALNDGRLYAFHRDHGHRDMWVQPNFTLNDMDALTNGDELPVVFSINCGTGLFVKPEPDICFAEKLQRHPNGGAVGIVAASAETLSGYNDGFIIGMMDAIWSNPGFIPSMGAESDTAIPTPHGSIYTMGDVMIQGLIRMTETWAPNGWADGIQFHLYHYFGDPAMQIWTEQPVQITAQHDAVVSAGVSSLYISDLNCSDVIATICIDGQLVQSTRITNKHGSIILPEPLDCSVSELTLTISHHNFIPYIATITVAHEPEAYFEASEEEICMGGQISFTDLSSEDPYKWLWTVEPNTFEFKSSSPSSQNPVIHFLAPGEYTVSLAATNDCGSGHITREDIVEVKEIPAAPAVTDKSRCSYDEIPVLSASGMNIRWYADQELDEFLAEGNQYLPEEAKVGETRFYPTQTKRSCESEPAELVLLTYPETPMPLTSGSTICEYDTAVFTASGNEVRWYNDLSSGEIIHEGDTLIRFPLEPGEQILYASSTENGCESVLNPCTVLVNSQPEIPVAEDVEICYGEDVELRALGHHIYWYTSVDPPAPVFFGNVYIQGIPLPGEYTYYLTQETNHCTSGFGETHMIVNPLPEFSLGGDTTLCYSDTIVLNSPVEGNSYWFNGSEEKSVQFVAAEYGLGDHECWLQLTSPEGCQSSDTMMIKVERDPAQDNNFEFMGVIFSVYPNPSSGELFIKFQQAIKIPTTLILTDTQGRMIALQIISKVDQYTIAEMDISGLAAGVYLLTIDNEDIVHTLSIVKE
jgi:PKD repeat protein